MGFHIEVGSDVQFVTSGHCGVGGLSNDWFHPGLGGNHLIGGELATLYGDHGFDAMRVQMTTAQSSRNIYGSIKLVLSVRDSIQGEAICASLGNSNSWTCGTVTSAATNWQGEACGGCLIFGAKSSITAILGDSGSPIVNNTAGDKTAIGLMATATGYFAEMGTVLGAFGAVLH